MKKVIKTMGSLTLGLVGYDILYRIINRYDTKGVIEKLLDFDQSLLELPWVSEADYSMQMEQVVKPYLAQKMTEGNTVKDAHKIVYSHYQPETVEQTIVITHGFNEFKERYLEFIYYLVQSNIEVFVYDVHDHGQSRENLSSSLIDVEDYAIYLQDLHHLLYEVVLETRTLDVPLILFGHSMGGAITMKYCIQYPPVADGLILNTPMLAVTMDHLPLSFMHIGMKSACLFGKGQDFAPSMQPYNPKIHYDFSMKSGASVRENYYQHKKLTTYSVPTWGGSYRWLKESIELSQAASNRYELSQLKMPVLLWRAQEDHLVDAKGIQQAAKYLPRVQAMAVPEGRHNLFLENDERLYPYITETINFIKKVTKIKRIAKSFHN